MMVKRTTLTFEPDVAKRLERLQRRLGVRPKQLINRALREGLNALEAQPKARPHFKVVPLGASPILIPIDNISEALAMIDEEPLR